MTGENWSTWRKTCPSPTQFNTNPTWTAPWWSNLSHQSWGERPVTNWLSHNITWMASIVVQMLCKLHYQIAGFLSYLTFTFNTMTDTCTNNYSDRNYTLSFSEMACSISAILLWSSVHSCSCSRSSCFASSTCWFTWALRNSVASFSPRSRSSEILRLALWVLSASRASLNRETSNWRVVLPDFSPENKNNFNALGFLHESM